MNKLIAVSLFFLAAVPAGAYKAGDVMPCDSTMAIEGMCKYGGTYTVTAQDVATDQRNQEQYEQSAAMWARLYSKCEREMDMMGLCCNRDKFPAVIPTPCPGAAAEMKKVYKFDPPSIAQGERGDPNAMNISTMRASGEGLYATEISACGHNPLFASLNDPAASCDLTAQDIVAWNTWQVQNPDTHSGCSSTGWGIDMKTHCYKLVNDTWVDISQAESDSLAARHNTFYVFKSWEALFRSGELGAGGAASSSNSAASSAKKLSGGGFKPFATGSSTPNAAGQTGGLVIGGGVHPETAGQIAQ